MKTNNYYRYLLLLLLFSFTGASTYAYDIAVANADGVTIYYNFINDGTELEVTYNPSQKYSGSINIPDVVSQMKVTSIGVDAFQSCENLISVKIGNNVSTIKGRAFEYCKALASVDIPNSVTSIGNYAFHGCEAFTSITIPNSVTNLGIFSFYCCHALSFVSMGDGIKQITESAFSACGLKSISFGKNVISIGKNAFEDCIELSSLYIPNGILTIGEKAFYNCYGLEVVSIPNSVMSIGEKAFGCLYNGGLTSNINTVISFMETPFSIPGNTFNSETFSDATLYVPSGTLDIYKATDGWKSFANIAEGADECAKPTIEYNNGKLTFKCDTEDVEFISSITDSDIKDYTTAEIDLTVTYHLSVYAKKAGHVDSEIAMATLCWIDTTPTTEGISNGIAQISANAVLIQADDGFISVSGVGDGQQVAIYQTDGKQVATAKAYNGSANVATNISKGNTVIVKIGEKAVKVMMR